MFFKYTVPVPVAAGKISRQKTKSGTYILYVISRQYDPAKKHTVPVRAMIGKVSDEEGMMFPNEKFFEYFPETPLPELRPEAERSCTLMAGTFIAIEEVVNRGFERGEATAVPAAGKTAGTVINTQQDMSVWLEAGVELHSEVAAGFICGAGLRVELVRDVVKTNVERIVLLRTKTHACSQVVSG